MVRSCKVCGVEKPLGDFYPNGLPNGARKKTCKECDKSKLEKVRELRKLGAIPPPRPQRRLETDAMWIESQLLGSCKSKGRTLNLSIDEIDAIIHKPCFYCGGIDTRVMSRGRDGHFNSIDRLDSNGDYSPNNVVPCCAMCNIMKSTFTPVGFVAQCRAVAANSQVGTLRTT